MAICQLQDLDINGKRLLIREDLNVPINAGAVTNDARISAAIPTLKYACEKGARVMVMSHLGRPEEGVDIAEQPGQSLKPVAERLQQLSGLSVTLVPEYLDGFSWPNTDLVLFENIRLNEGEKRNDESLARKLAALCDIFVMDAFGTAHRAHASTEGVARYAAKACAGPLLSSELSALEQALAKPASPVVAIVGGSKVSTKLEVLQALVEKVDYLIVGGGIANTFLAAKGFNIGKSLAELELLDVAKSLLQQVDIPLPVDVVVGNELSENAAATSKPVDQVNNDEMILDIGAQSSAVIADILKSAKTIIWNGPVGVFEFKQFAGGTEKLAHSIAESAAFSLAGGGDTLAAIDKFGVRERISYISTGGGAFLEFIEGKTLPAVAVLEHDL